MNSTYISTLTPLRGIAAILVLTFHFDLFLYPLANKQVVPLLGNCWLWVDFFFVLSGFILSHVYQDTFRDKITKAGYWGYLRARFARVYPLHLFTLCWALAAGILILSRPIENTEWSKFYHLIFEPWTVPASLALLQAMHLFQTAPLNGVSWSLSTEWWMYMLFPFLAANLLRSDRLTRLLWLAGIAGCYGLLKYYLVPVWGRHMGQPRPATLNTINDFAFLRCMAGFLLGMLTYKCYQIRTARRWLQKDAIFVLVTVALMLSLQADANELIIVSLFPVLILAAAYNETRVYHMLNTKVLQRLGDWSFSIYMVHIPIFFSYLAVRSLLGRHLPLGIMDNHPDYWRDWAYFLPFLVITLGIAFLVYKFLEIPARSYLKKWPASAATDRQPIPENS